MEPFNTLLAASTLLYTSYLDVRTREVDDVVWVVAASLGLVLNAFSVYSGGLGELLRYGFAVAVSGAVAFALYFGGLYGGADAKALLTIAVIQPYVYTWPTIHGINALTTLTNGMLLSASLPLSFAAYNLFRLIRGEKIFKGFESERKIRKLAACFIGVRVSKSAGKPFWSPVEKTENGVRKFDFNISIDDIEMVKGNDMWITPGIPLLVFFTAGYFINLLAGDLMGWVLFSLTR
ncbi:MAG: prepilin peptidase [Candidatus Caldarchaeum sp.]|nr:prepilin peptidase [Candidatus Caldarchaeum sp.]MDW8359236.1 prepilin peptidase [Candidatus Caldarchaeum sp.]